MEAALGASYQVIAEGLNGRTTAFEDPTWEGRNGKRFLPICLETHAPLDCAVIMLGTNDLKSYLRLTPSKIAAGARSLVRMARQDVPHVLLVCPPRILSETSFDDIFAGAIEKSSALPAAYRAVAESRGCGFFDAGAVVNPGAADGVHLDLEGHGLLGEALASIISSPRDPSPCR